MFLDSISVSVLNALKTYKNYTNISLKQYPHSTQLFTPDHSDIFTSHISSCLDPMELFFLLLRGELVEDLLQTRL